ncbi:MAG: enoyl-CoA hydratase-related protein [Gemmatimonadota bacterium]
MPETILLERVGGVARVTLNRPDVLNSFNPEMFSRMLAVLDEVGADRSVRAVLITGSGRGFSAGQDLAGGISEGSYGDHLEHSWNKVVRRLRAMEKPVVAAVNGVAAGAGANLALNCDFVIAAEEASFIQAFINIGLVPDTGGSWILPHLVGTAHAAAMLMLGEKVPAQRAYELGMVYKVVPLAGLEGEAMGLATRLAAMPTMAIALTKQLIQAAATNTLAEQLVAEAEMQTIAGKSADHGEGVAAFREKRKAVFKGE